MQSNTPCLPVGRVSSERMPIDAPRASPRLPLPAIAAPCAHAETLFTMLQLRLSRNTMRQPDVRRHDRPPRLPLSAADPPSADPTEGGRSRDDGEYLDLGRRSRDSACDGPRRALRVQSLPRRRQRTVHHPVRRITPRSFPRARPPHPDTPVRLPRSRLLRSGCFVHRDPNADCTPTACLSRAPHSRPSSSAALIRPNSKDDRLFAP